MPIISLGVWECIQGNYYYHDMRSGLISNLSHGGCQMITKKDIWLMPITFIIAPTFLLFLVFVAATTYGDMLEEKAFIAGLSCPELEEYRLNQIVESKKYFGNEAYLIYAEERYSGQC